MVIQINSGEVSYIHLFLWIKALIYLVTFIL